MKMRHPHGLTVLYLTEVWERFSFYGLRALLVLYLNSGVLEDTRFQQVYGANLVLAIFGRPTVQALSSQINEMYSGVAYLTPLAGGVVADHMLGTRATLIVGGLLMAAGHGCMAYERTFLVGLLLLVLGNGGFKPTITALLSRLYEQPGLAALRDRGFAIFYTGINVGALLAPLVCGALQMHIGYDAGFGAAGVGMLIGLVVFLAGSSHIPRDDGQHTMAELRRPDPHGERLLPFAQQDDGHDPPPAGAAGTARGGTMAALLGLCALIIPYWMAFEQQANTMPLFFRDMAQRELFGGFTVPAAWLQALSPLFCVCLMPVVTALWAAQARRGTEPQPCIKMALGCMLQGASWLLVALGSISVSEQAKAPFALPVAAVVLLSAGQLYLAPVGLALVSRLAPPSMRSTAVGFWFVSGGLGGVFAGPLGALYSSWTPPAFFALLSMLCMVNGLLLATAGPALHRMAAARGGDAHAKRDDDQTLLHMEECCD